MSPAISQNFLWFQIKIEDITATGVPDSVFELCRKQYIAPSIVASPLVTNCYLNPYNFMQKEITDKYSQNIGIHKPPSFDAFIQR